MSLLISVERIAELVDATAKNELAQARLVELAFQKEQAERQAEQERKRALFEASKPVLAAQAQSQHDARFAPLRALTDPLIDPLIALRNRYIPGYLPTRTLVVAEAYLTEYKDDPFGITGDNTYARGLMIPVDKSRFNSPHILYAVATCIEPQDTRILKWHGKPPQPQYYLSTGEYTVGDPMRDFSDRIFKFAIDRRASDFADINSVHKPYQIYMTNDGDAEVKFHTQVQVLPDLPEPERFSLRFQDPFSFIQEQTSFVEQRLADLFSYWARQTAFDRAGVA